MEAEQQPKKEKTAKKLDYTIQAPDKRSAYVKDVIDNSSSDQLTEKYIEILADYIIFAMDKEERKRKEILTDNRMVTVNKRETSYQGLVSKFENGEDGVYNLIINDKNVLLTPKISITQEDIDEIKPLKELRDAIEIVREQEKKATGKKKYLLKKQLIEMCQQQYVIKTEYKPPIQCSNVVKSFARGIYEDKITIDENGEPHNDGLLSFFNPKHLSALLCNYSALKEEAYGNFTSDA